MDHGVTKNKAIVRNGTFQRKGRRAKGLQFPVNRTKRRQGQTVVGDHVGAGGPVVPGIAHGNGRGDFGRRNQDVIRPPLYLSRCGVPNAVLPGHFETAQIQTLRRAEDAPAVTNPGYAVKAFYMWKQGMDRLRLLWKKKNAILGELVQQREEIKAASDDLRQPMSRMTTIIMNLSEKESTLEEREQLNALHAQMLQLITRVSDMQTVLENPEERVIERPMVGTAAI